MGSVLAVLARAGEAPADALARMARAAPHRGSPRETVTRGAVALAATSGERRDGWIAVMPDMAVVFSGILDNAEELRREWAAEARANPAGIVAAGLRRAGPDATARRLRGVFAVVATDGRRLWAFRDQIGFHPLVYRRDPGGLLVGAEPKEVVAGAGIDPRPDLEALARIYYGARETTACAVAGNERLEAATVLEADGERVRLRRYWDPEALLERGPALSGAALRERFHALMERAVERCLAGDDVVSLSGGVDSPAVAAFAAPLYRSRTGHPLAALSAVFPDHPSVDESGWIDTVAGELGLRLHTFEPRASPTDRLAEWVEWFDGPVPVVAFGQVHEFLETARGLGFRNVLSGELQEFVFEMRREALPHLVRRGRLIDAFRLARARRARGARAGKLVRRALTGVLPVPIHRRAIALRHRRPPGLPPWIEAARVTRLRDDPPPSWRLDQLIAFHGTGLSLAADDTIQQVAGVRERRPFADVDLWEFALGLPAEVKHGEPESKSLIRRLLRGTVPDPILDRRDKTVFDSWVGASIDYDALRRWLRSPAGPRLPGIRYELLAERLEREELTLTEYVWAKDLAGVHAFLAARAG
jgi:asparagine synthase (glutamine-hydrolysing)